MKKFVAISAACAAALCISTTTFARTSPMMPARAMIKMEKKVDKAVAKKLHKIFSRRSVQNKGRMMQHDYEAKTKIREAKSSSRAATHSSSSSAASVSSAASSASSSSTSSAASSAASSAQ